MIAIVGSRGIGKNQLRAGELFRLVPWNQAGSAALAGARQPQGIPMSSFFRRLMLHYGIYRRYPLRPLPALRNAWRIARP
jgi:hypothetical protein